MSKQVIKAVCYNFFFTPEGEDSYSYTVGKSANGTSNKKSDVVTYIEHIPQLNCCHVFVGSKKIATVFNINEIIYA